MKKLYHMMLTVVPRPLLIRFSYVFRLFAPLIYKGNNVECPVCDHRFSKFLAYGREQRPRENVLCPYCLSLERHRLMWLYLKNKTDFFTRPKKVLHVAPEQCFYQLFRKQANLDYTTADLYSPLADLKFDLHDIPLDDNRYDVIFCNHVMEHVEDDHRCMSELFRVLKPEGFAIMQVPIDHSREQTYEDPEITSPEDREREFWQRDHVRLYGLDYPKRLERAGFKVSTIDLIRELGQEQTTPYRLMSTELLYIAIKP